MGQRLLAAPFLEGILANPDDLETYRVYGDWLAQQGDVWGNVIAIQHALATLPRFGVTQRRDELEREETLLLYEHRERLWGALATEIFDEGTQRALCDMIDATWRCGFVRSIRITNRDVVMRSLPRIARLDTMRLLQHLELEAGTMNRAFGEALAKVLWPELRRIELLGHGDQTPDARAILRLLDTMPKLVEILMLGAIEADAMLVSLATLPIAQRLRSLELHDCVLEDTGVAALAGGEFPELDRLVITGDVPDNARGILERCARHVRIENVRA
ncbi:MAG: hypothetical protein QM831_23290 [Kofleriaceae bacterium]